ncbi:MAG: protein-disulfide reductase DsbD family protein [Bryobacteraceae bacterium]
MLRIALLALAIVSSRAFAKEDPVSWTLSPENNRKIAAPGSKAYLQLQAKIESGWHLYSPTTPPGGPIITKIAVTPSPALSGVKIYRPEPVRKLDPNFNIDTETYTGTAHFVIEGDAAPSASGTIPIETTVRYQACSDTKCLPPVKKVVQTSLTFGPVAAGQSKPFEIPAGYLLVPAGAGTTAPPPAASPSSSSVAASPIRNSKLPKAGSEGTLPFMLTAFAFGLAALFTPCVFPMIPITVSFFLGQDTRGGKRGALAQALVFCLGIVVLFTALGFLVTAVAGPFGVVQLGSSPWVNSFISLVFFVFGLSLLGAFELTLPSSFLTKLNTASQAGGYVGTLLMGLTFSLTSFACIGPIVGPLLIASVQSKGPQPVLGMLAFASGLATPFFLLALFPGYLKRLPRSGGWMARVKIVLGFVVLAVMFKYLSNIDQVLQTHWLTRERFLAAWIVLFALPGVYLLGLLPMEGIKKDERLGVTRALIASAFLIFSVSLVPGLFNARLGDLDAFIPEVSASSLPGVAGADTKVTLKNDLPGALAAARERNKLILVNFTGYACTNCHWMKANMFPRPEIQAALKDMVIVDLFTDGTDPDSERNQQLEDSRFGTASIPFYAIMDPDQHVIATFPELTRNPQEFLSFLKSKPNQSLTMVR